MLETSLLEWSGVAVEDGRAVGLRLYSCNLMGKRTSLPLFVFPDTGMVDRYISSHQLASPAQRFPRGSDIILSVWSRPRWTIFEQAKAIFTNPFAFHAKCLNARSWTEACLNMEGWGVLGHVQLHHAPVFAGAIDT